MKKKQKLLTTQSLFLFAIPTIVIVLFLFLSPKISSEVFSFKRQAILNQFISSTKVSEQIDPQKYWEFREFYSPGYFTFSNKGVSEPIVKQANHKIGIELDNKKVNLSFLVFSSPLLESIDMLTANNNINEVFKLKIQKEDIIFKGKNSLIYKQDQNNIKIIFLLSNAEMKKANGFFDYNEKDKKITEGKNWLNTTTVKTN